MEIHSAVEELERVDRQSRLAGLRRVQFVQTEASYAFAFNSFVRLRCADRVKDCEGCDMP
jgi:hypothetical protein